jgi:molybdate transport system substrate-binding protein
MFCRYNRDSVNPSHIFLQKEDHMSSSFFKKTILITVGSLVFLPFAAKAVEIKVMSSGGFYSALEELAPIYEKKTGNKIVLISGSSMGSSPTAIPARLQRGEDADLVIMAGPELDKLISKGFVVPGSRVDLVLSKIGMCVRSGAIKPDISTTYSFIRTVLAAKSIGYSASASGTYLAEELFPQLGIWDKIKDKSKLIVKDRVGTWVARGDLEIGFQQVSEILSIPGVDFIGPIPEDVQQITIFSSGVASGSKQLAEGKKLVQFLTSQAAKPVIVKQGLELVSAKKK